MPSALGGGRDTSQDGDYLPTVSPGAEKRRHGVEGKETGFKEGSSRTSEVWGGFTHISDPMAALAIIYT